MNKEKLTWGPNDDIIIWAYLFISARARRRGGSGGIVESGGGGGQVLGPFLMMVGPGARSSSL